MLDHGMIVRGYIVGDEVGLGQYYRVYRARRQDSDPRDWNWVIKCTLPEHVDEQLVAALMAEAELLKRLDDTWTPQYEEHGQDRIGHHDVAFIVMERIVGVTLAKIYKYARKDKALPPIQSVIAIAHDLLDGMEEVHRQGTPEEPAIWLDCKLGNAILQPNGQVRIFDFGISPYPGRNIKARPQHGALVGSYTYMSPEQVRCDPLDIRSDFHSLGIVLFGLIAGRSPYGAHDNAYSLLKAVAKREFDQLEVGLERAPEQLAHAIRLFTNIKSRRPHSARAARALLPELSPRDLAIHTAWSQRMFKTHG